MVDLHPQISVSYFKINNRSTDRSSHQISSTGSLLLTLPPSITQRPPLRTIFSGFKEAPPEIGLNYLVIYEADGLTWLIRLFDSKSGRLFSIFVLKDDVAREIRAEKGVAGGKGNLAS